MKKITTLLLLALAWLLLFSGAPQTQQCTESSAAFVLRQPVSRTVQSNGAAINVPAGFVAAWSCSSQAEAQAELTRLVASIP
jgi:hypothetical protein